MYPRYLIAQIVVFFALSLLTAAEVRSDTNDRERSSDLSKIMSAARAVHETQFGKGGVMAFEKVHRRVFLDARTEDNEGQALDHPPALVVQFSQQKGPRGKVVSIPAGSYYLEFDTDLGSYISQACYCCHLFLEDAADGLRVHCDTICDIPDARIYEAFETYSKSASVQGFEQASKNTDWFDIKAINRSIANGKIDDIELEIFRHEEKDSGGHGHGHGHHH